MKKKLCRDGRNHCAVCLFGPDGSGKTTLAKMLYDAVIRQGVDAAVVWVRGTHTLASLIARFVSLVSGDAWKENPCNPYYGICIQGNSKHIWATVEVMGVTPVIFHRFIIAKRFHDVIIAERSPPDFIVWLFLTFGGEPPPALALLYALSVTSMVCDKLVYVTADPEVLMERRPEDAERISLSLGIYDALADLLGAPKIDTTAKSPEESLAELLEVIGRGVME